mmetsp:Transcript_9040/g.13344  ORF Transcript_9040/g.13344 Transcript_9040/m.13344 type:complete len:82 (-) Transcript_9040:205-450(-)
MAHRSELPDQIFGSAQQEQPPSLRNWGYHCIPCADTVTVRGLAASTPAPTTGTPGVEVAAVCFNVEVLLLETMRGMAPTAA